jgi:23S rRNA (cytosine1962-C5)-methyltransferase
MRAMSSHEPARLLLKRDRERSLLRRHPWIFSGAVHALHGRADSGDTVEVCAHDGSVLACAAYSPSSRIVARVWDFARDTVVDDAFFARRIGAAVALRRALLPPTLLSYRVVNAESDGLPGLTVDRYAGQLVLQATSAGAAANRERIARALAAATGLSAIYERSEGEVLELEGLSPRRGPLLGSEPMAPIAVEEHGVHVAVDVRAGHKTGFYLDQRDNRALVRELAAGRDVLDCFCYTGAFSLCAAAGGARSVTAVDSSDEALAAARANAALNAPAGAAIHFERADVFEFLRRARDARLGYDLIVLDPPKFAPTARHVERATRAYKDINLLAFKLLRPGGLLMTFSCSAAIGAELFQKVVAGAAVDAGADARFTRRLGAGVDHPVALPFPEGEYLKGLLCARG